MNIKLQLYTHFCTLLFITFFTSANAQAEEKALVIDRAPENVAQFLTLRNEIGQTPEGGAAMFLLALQRYQEEPSEGLKFLILTTDKSQLVKSHEAESYGGYTLHKVERTRMTQQLEQYPYLIHSYFAGAIPENDYTPAPAPFSFTFSLTSYSGSEKSGRIRLYIPSSGTDTPRPITLRRDNKGIWKVTEYSSLLVGIRLPEGLKKSDF